MKTEEFPKKGTSLMCLHCGRVVARTIKDIDRNDFVGPSTIESLVPGFVFETDRPAICPICGENLLGIRQSTGEIIIMLIPVRDGSL